MQVAEERRREVVVTATDARHGPRTYYNNVRKALTCTCKNKRGLSENL